MVSLLLISGFLDSCSGSFATVGGGCLHFQFILIDVNNYMVLLSMYRSLKYVSHVSFIFTPMKASITYIFNLLNENVI